MKIWDQSAIDALDKVVLNFHKNGIKTELIGMSEECKILVNQMTLQNKEVSLEV